LAVIAIPTVHTTGLAEYVRLLGGEPAPLTVMVRTAVVLPEAFVAVTV
jgi:hypothetical protein